MHNLDFDGRLLSTLGNKRLFVVTEYSIIDFYTRALI